MSKLITKARAGVTLVELLVVILIVTILSVSLLPMFKDYIVKSQYAAEAIPVIGNLRTKIGLYQYEHSTLPKNSTDDTKVSSWEIDDTDKEKYVIAEYTLGTAPSATENALDSTKLDSTGKESKADLDAATATAIHLGHASVLDIDFQDLRGRRSRPIDYVYYQIKCEKTTDSAYVVGCFGAGHGGFAEGTGYAVCELNLVSVGKKYIGTFERYKAKEKTGECPYLYLSNGDDAKEVNGDTVYCPNELTDADITAAGGGDDRPNIVKDMELAGWTFTK